MNAQVSLGSQPQNRPQALSAQIAPAMTANVQIGKPKTAVRCATRSRTAAAGSPSTTYAPEPPARAPAVTLASNRERSRYSTLAMPLTKQIPKPRIAVVTWIASQYDRNAATSGLASV